MEQIYKKVTFQLGEVLNSDHFYPNSYFKSRGIKPLEEDETEEDRQKKQRQIEEQERERLRKLQQNADELEAEELRKLKEQQEMEENARQLLLKEQAEKQKQTQKGILKKSKIIPKPTMPCDEYGNPINQNHPLYRLKHFNVWDNKQQKISPGLTNFGNTCFINSILQVVTYTPSIANYFTSKKHSAICPINSSKKKPLVNTSLVSLSPTSSTFTNKQTFCLMCFLENHINKCFTAGVTIIHPVVIVNNMHKLITDFKIGKQEDPLTFFMIIVSSIKKEPYNLQAGGSGEEQNKINSTKTIDIESLNQPELLNGQGDLKNSENQDTEQSESTQLRKEEEKQYMKILNQKNADLFNNMFTGAIQYNISCQHCKMEQIQYEIFYTLVLEIKGMDSLDDCLSSKFAEKEVTCKQCKTSKAIRTANLYNFPNIMVIKINRFYEIMKIQKNIDFKTELNLQEYSISKSTSSSHNYVLYSMLTHQGSVAWGGHYYSYIKDSNDTWYCMNDSSVRQVSLNEVKQDPPYLLFYIKQEPAHQLAVPEDLVRQIDQLKELSRSLSQKRNLHISSKKKIDLPLPPENFYNVLESPAISARNGSNLFTKRSNNPSPVQKVGPGYNIGPLREPSKSPQHLRLKSSLGAPTPIRSRPQSINENILYQQPGSTKYSTQKKTGKNFITPQRHREQSYDLKKIQNEEKSYYLIPISDEKQRSHQHQYQHPHHHHHHQHQHQQQNQNQQQPIIGQRRASGDGEKVKLFRRKSKQLPETSVATSMNNAILNHENAFQQNFDFEKSRIIGLPKIKKNNAEQSDYLKLSEISMMSPTKLNGTYLSTKHAQVQERKRNAVADQKQQHRQSPQRSPQNKIDKQFNFYEDYEKRFAGSGFAQQVYNISYISGSSTRNSDYVPFISPKKPSNGYHQQLSDGPFQFGYMNDESKQYSTFNNKRHKQSMQDEIGSDYQTNLSALSCTEPYRSNADKTPTDLQNTFEMTNQFQNLNQIKNKTQSTIYTQKQIPKRQNSLNGNKTSRKRKSRKRASSFDHIRTLLENCEYRNKSLPDKLFLKYSSTTTSPTNIKKKKKQLKSAKVQKPDWQF